MLNYGTNPAQVVLARAVDEALEAWAAEAEQRPDKWNADAMTTIQVSRATIRNLLAGTSEEGVQGTVAFSQVLAYAWDQGHEIQKIRGLPRPVFPDAESWIRLVDDVLEGLTVLALQAGFPVRRRTFLQDNAFSSMIQVPRLDQNRALLKAHFGMLDLVHFRCLQGETVFSVDENLMSAPWMLNTPWFCSHCDGGGLSKQFQRMSCSLQVALPADRGVAGPHI